MIEKMNFISITGPKYDIDRVIDKYVSRHEIHLENALEELQGAAELKPYTETNPYKDSVRLANELLAYTDGIAPEQEAPAMNVDYAMQYIQEAIPRFKQMQKDIDDVQKEKEVLQDKYDKVAPFKGLHYDISKILTFDFVRFRFGRIPKQYWTQFSTYAEEDCSMIFIQCAVDEQYIWGIYFVPAKEHDKIDAIYASLHFEKTFLPEEYNGTPTEVSERILKEIDAVDTRLRDLESVLQNTILYEKPKLFSAAEKVQTASDNFDVRKMAAVTKEHGNVFYIICGWLTEKDTQLLLEETAGDPEVVILVDEPQTVKRSIPPTKLKNHKLFKPFELFVRMYGLPAYGECDPTPFVALTYAFIFGAMFGDVGQGLLLLIGGGLLYRFKKIPLAGVISRAGIFSTLFGFLFGSVFGFEDWIEPLWLHPKSESITIPFVGSLNTVLVVAIAFGMFMILVTMILNIVNSMREHNLEQALFSSNGIAGLVFYGSVVTVIVLFMTGHALPAGIVMAVMFGIPLLLIVLKEPLGNLISHKAQIMTESKGMFIVQSFFELFEVLLSYFSNTISFVRIGAFAISHAAMMEVVLMLAGYTEANPHANIIVIILGNLFVCGMEGLVVGIQVLRLEYYEMFSRFYKGTGREFVPYTKTNNQ